MGDVIEVSAPTSAAGRKKTIKELRALVRKAEAKLDATTGRSAINAAAKRLVRAPAEIKVIEAEDDRYSRGVRW
jgi:hypothetical protein